jgi:hypothetical protein
MYSGLEFAPIDQKSQLATDFREHAVGADLSANGWTHRVPSGTVAALVETNAASISGRRVNINEPVAAVRAVTWDLIPSATTDIEILAIIVWGSAGTNGGSGLIARATSTAQDAYNCVQHGTASPTNGVFEAAEIAGGFYSVLTQGSTVPVAGTRYYVRFQCVGTTVRGKIWAVSAAEPAGWESSDTDATRASGFAGLMVVDTSPDWFCEWFSAAIGSGKSAPFPNG